MVIYNLLQIKKREQHEVKEECVVLYPPLFYIPLFLINKKMKWQNYPSHRDVSSRLHLPREQDAFDWEQIELQAGGVS